jgi:hypothetical protein
VSIHTLLIFRWRLNNSSEFDSSDDELEASLGGGGGGEAATVGPVQDLCIDPSAVFEKAMAAFRDSVPADKKSQLVQCANSEALILNIETTAYSFKNKTKVSRLMACCNIIKRFAQAWEPFFEVTSILVSSNPEYAALAWGAIRFVFVVCCFLPR